MAKQNRDGANTLTESGRSSVDRMRLLYLGSIKDLGQQSCTSLVRYINGSSPRALSVALTIDIILLVSFLAD
jgi:hypothetical protein